MRAKSEVPPSAAELRYREFRESLQIKRPEILHSAIERAHESIGLNGQRRSRKSAIRNPQSAIE